jgi:hypothetical protein
VAQLLERAAKSPLPPYYEVPAHIARLCAAFEGVAT